MIFCPRKSIYKVKKVRLKSDQKVIKSDQKVIKSDKMFSKVTKSEILKIFMLYFSISEVTQKRKNKVI